MFYFSCFLKTIYNITDFITFQEQKTIRTMIEYDALKIQQEGTVL